MDGWMDGRVNELGREPERAGRARAGAAGPGRPGRASAGGATVDLSGAMND